MLKLKEEDKKKIRDIIRKGKNDARVIYRANALNLRSKGYTFIEVANILEITSKTASNIEQNYEEGGLEKALYEDPRPGQPIVIDDRVKSHIVATVCSEPPEGFDRWTLLLLQDEIVKNGIIDSISLESIRIVLQEDDLKPWKQASWCIPKLDGEFIERMEDVLDVYERPLNENKPVVCIDEKCIQLLDDIRPPSGIEPGKDKKVDYEYKRNGTCNIFCAVEPLAGKYINEVTGKRTAEDFAKFLLNLESQYSQAEKIILIMDNLNTHKLKSLIDLYGEENGKAIWDRFEVHYTPKHGSWLNQAEIAINMYARQCLGKSRIPDIESLRKKTKAWNTVVNEKKVTINWRFSTQDARTKFKYDKIEKTEEIKLMSH